MIDMLAGPLGKERKLEGCGVVVKQSRTDRAWSAKNERCFEGK